MPINRKDAAESLETINVSENKIEQHGCYALTKANWTKISIIDLSNIILTKKIIKLET